MTEKLNPNRVLERYFDILGHFSAYERRESQETMVLQIAEAIGQFQSMAIEAGTGSGKSFGYLIPALFQQGHQPVVISTATIALQEQLIHKDIPFLAEAAGLSDLKVRLVKGRSNYLCIQKLTELEHQLSKTDGARMYINYLKGELLKGWDGDLGTLDLNIPRDVWAEIASETDDCLGRKCRYYDENPYRIAREDLEEADILVVNHALYFQDLASGNSLLPEHQLVIFDEAHQLKPYAISALTTRIGKYATTRVLRKIAKRVQQVPEPMIREVTEIESRMLEWLFRHVSGNASQTSFRLYPDAEFLSMVETQKAILTEIEGWLGSVDIKQLPLSDELKTELDRDKVTVKKNKLLSQLQGLITRWEFFLNENPMIDQRVNWAEVDRDRLYFQLNSTPFNIAKILKTTLWPEKTAMLTSATLAVNQSLGYVKTDLGLEDALESILPSPFDYQNQCVLYLPSSKNRKTPLPDPNSRDYLMYLASEIEMILNTTQGRALALFTSYQNMDAVASALIPKLDWPCKVQGDLPRTKLIDWLKNTPNAVLFATATFWEGIDVPGESLSCVIIDKIPFAPPNDPVHQAIVDDLKARGQDWFTGYALPQAVIRLKQGFGRLIRTKTDRGLVAILDPRLSTKGYGRAIQNSMPACRVVRDLSEIPPVMFGKQVLPQPSAVLERQP